MSFTVEDFHDLIELLAQHPEWRAELRRHALRRADRAPSLVRQLVEAQARAEARPEDVEGRLERLDVAVGAAAAQGRTETLVGRFADRLGDIDGRALEHDFARRGSVPRPQIARRLWPTRSRPLADLLDDAFDDGRLTWDERVTILHTDLVMSGRRRDDGQDVYLLVEVSGRIEPYDVERAVDRAALLEKLGRPVIPVVAGRRIEADVADLAAEHGEWYALGGRVVPPRIA